ncbi:chemotaxis protein [Thiohalobacter sp. COW1]|uniref:CheW-like domain-containing protein n=1 Tax=Thiohalobacter thiocyanaticus TaxID=585455 RepID=A0A1Z4VV03_9GAMM|nr:MULTISPECIES: chemotaxis protein CheW [Thiohalobacter]BAZ95353.1 uncharacterized protein FOKN1_2996 [Thiohalobacter thiocyanaticus]BCO32696.1 chemotaxis protein [Thiohalobacter sp. COW1]
MDVVQDKVRSLLVPLRDRTLLVPNIAIAELIPWQDLAPVDSAPDWLMGILNWRGYELPVISFEAVRGDARPATDDQTHIAVMNSVRGEQGVPFYALVTAGIPHLARLGEGELQHTGAFDGVAASGELARVQFDNQRAIIPDLDALEALAADYVRQVA